MDSGATGFASIDKGFALKHNLPLTQLQSSRTVEVIDGRPTSLGHITHFATALLNINGHCETMQFFVTSLGHYPMVRGIPCLKCHDGTFQFRENRVLFSSEFCKRNCLGKQALNSEKGRTEQWISSNTQVGLSEANRCCPAEGIVLVPTPLIGSSHVSTPQVDSEKKVSGGRHLSRSSTLAFSQRKPVDI